jgi:phospholipid/cholesterol/gamma-HCH transport system substrate-binding protein
MAVNYTVGEKLTGLILLFCFGLMAAGTILVGAGREWLADYSRYFVLYQAGYSMLPGVKVKFLGLDIGRVTGLELTENNRIRVSLAILSEYSSRVRGDSRAEIKSPTLFGSEYVEIVAGSQSSQPIPPGGQIPGKDPKTIDDILNALRLEEKLAQFEGILKNIAALTDDLRDPNGPVLGSMENLRQITERVSQGQGTLGGLVAKDEAYQEILGLLGQLKEVSASINASASALHRDLPDLTRRLDSILQNLEAGSRSIPELARGAREGIRDVNQVLDSAKRNFLIRGNLSPDSPPEGLSRPARER